MSLGSDCSVAIYLRDHKLRSIAFPFDWSVTPMRTVIELLSSGFQNFLNEDNLIFLTPVHRKTVNDEKVQGELKPDIITPCYCKQYGTLYPHDFSERGRNDLLIVQQKYGNWINRLKILLNDKSNEFVFIANNAPTAPTSWRAHQFKLVSGNTFINDFNNWKNRIKTVFKKKYPHLKYSLHTLEEFKRL